MSLLTDEQVQRLLSNEIYYTTSRSGGSGGQHVNKVETKVTAIFDFGASKVLSQEQKQIISKLVLETETSSWQIRKVSQKTRFQLQNKMYAVNKLLSFLQKCLTPKVIRKKSKPSKTSILKIKEQKKRQSEKKLSRRKLGEY